MKPVKTEVITFRTDEETKKKIETMAAEKEWSVAQTIEKIIKTYFDKK